MIFLLEVIILTHSHTGSCHAEKQFCVLNNAVFIFPFVALISSRQTCVVLHLIRLHWPVLHVEVPDFDGEVVTSHHIASAVTELHI